MSSEKSLEPVKELLSSGDTEAAVDLLLRLSRTSHPAHYDSALLLKNRLETLQHRVIEGVLSPSEERVAWARISKGVVELVRQIERGEAPSDPEDILPPKENPEEKPRSGFFSKTIFRVVTLLVLAGAILVPIMIKNGPVKENQEAPFGRRDISDAAELRGRVVAWNGEPVPGARIVFENTITVSTDSKGGFEVKVPEKWLNTRKEVKIFVSGKEKISMPIRISPENLEKLKVPR